MKYRLIVTGAFALFVLWASKQVHAAHPDIPVYYVCGALLGSYFLGLFNMMVVGGGWRGEPG